MVCWKVLKIIRSNEADNIGIVAEIIQKRR